jgi:signal transduction histidine kinase
MRGPDIGPAAPAATTLVGGHLRRRGLSLVSVIDPEEPCPRGPGVAVTAGATAAVSILVVLTMVGLAQADSTARLMFDIAVAVVSIGLIPVTLRWPVAGGVALGVLVALSPVATPPATVAVLYTARTRRLPQALVVAGVGLTGQAIQGWWRPAHGLAYGWWFLLMVAAYAALVGIGALAQARAALLISLSERVRRAEAEQDRRVAEARLAERNRIARDMHDVLAHRLSLLATYAGALEYRPDAPPERLAAAAGIVRDGVHQALDELRQVVTLLRDPEDDGSAPDLADVERLIDEARAAGLTVEFERRITGEPAPIVGRTAFRIVQEGLTNARKHAPGAPVRLIVDGIPGERLDIEVSNPMPARPPERLPGAGTGLVGIAERAELTGGSLTHGVTAADDFRLAVSLPWQT